MWDLDTGKELQSFKVEESFPFSKAAFSPDGRHVLVGRSTAIGLWDIQQKKELSSVNYAKFIEPAATKPQTSKSDGYQLTSVAFSRDGRRALFGIQYEPFYQHEFRPGEQVYKTDPVSKPGLQKFTMSLWDVETWKELKRFDLQNRCVRCLAFSADGSRALSGGDDNIVQLWELPP